MAVFPDELWPKAAAVGILGLGYPEEFGGVSEGIDLWYSIILNEEMARVAVGGVGATLLVHGIGLPPVINFGSDEVKQMVAPPVLAGTKRISFGIHRARSRIRCGPSYNDRAIRRRPLCGQWL